MHDFHAELAIADFSKSRAFWNVYRRVKPDIVFNLAGYGVDPTERDAKLAVALNTTLVSEIAMAAVRAQQSDWRGLRVVHAGSAAEYGAVRETLVEQTPANPVTLYGRTKLAGTGVLSALSAHGLRVTTVRLFTVYGPGEHPGRLLPLLLDSSRTKQPLDLTAGTQQRDFTYAGDVAEGMVRIGCRAGSVPPVVNLATGKLTAVRRFAEIAAAALRIRRGLLRFGALPVRGDEMRQGRADITRLVRLLRWRPRTSIRSGVLKTAAFEKRIRRGAK